MFKQLNIHSLATLFLLAAFVFLMYSHYQVLELNRQLATQVSQLSSQLNSQLAQVNNSNNKIEQHLEVIENKLEPKFQDLLTLNN